MSAALDGLYDVVRHGNGETNLRGYDGADAWQTQNFCPTEICAIEPNEEIAAELDTVWQSTTNDTIDVATDLGGRLPDCWGENQETGEAGFDISRDGHSPGRYARARHMASSGRPGPPAQYSVCYHNDLRDSVAIPRKRYI